MLQISNDKLKIFNMYIYGLCNVGCKILFKKFGLKVGFRNYVKIMFNIYTSQ